MKRIWSIIVIGICVVNCVLFCCCAHRKYDKEQIYHEGYEELERYINAELGDYLTIESYQEPIDDNGYLVIYVYFRSSYCDDPHLIDQFPIWSIVDKFRCSFNDFIIQNTDYWDDRVFKYDIYFCIDDGDYIDSSIARLCNYVNTLDSNRENNNNNTYDYIITEEVYCDSNNLDNKDELICLYIGYYGDLDNPSIDQCIDYFCDRLNHFPNLRFFKIIYAPFPESDWNIITEGIINRNSNLSGI